MRNTSQLKIIAAIILFPIFAASIARAEDDAWFAIPIDHLTITQGKLPPGWPENVSGAGTSGNRRYAYAVVDGAGEALVNIAGTLQAREWRTANLLLIHTPEHRDVTGRLFAGTGDETAVVEVWFKVAAAEAKPAARQAFYTTMAAHYEQLLEKGDSGAAWFRHQANAAREAIGIDSHEPDEAAQHRPSSLDDTFSLLSGNEALAENLQLDRMLPPSATKPGATEVAVDAIKGITVAPIDWAPYIKGENPKTDPLAKAIPADQPAIFIADFPSLIALVDEADRYGTPALQFTEPQSQDAGTRQRYEHQLGLSLTGLGKLLGPHLINSIAITASDPYLRSGGDLAIIFQPKDGNTLKGLLAAEISAARQTTPGAKEVDGKLDDLQYTGSVTPDRSLCSYLAELKDGTLVVTNSLAQLARLAAVDAGKGPTLASTPEYTFFRDRYPLGDADESALVILTDATIRRWCGPQWRIADSRRTRAAAVLADLNANYLDELVSGKQESKPVSSPYAVPNLGELRLTPNGATSSTYGSLDFLTPISELKMDTVTEGEAAAYGRWRDSYETNWRKKFDPIAIRLGVHDMKISADVTVMPLILGTNYGLIQEITTGSKLNPAISDPHDTVFVAGLAINGPWLQFIGPFGWGGPSVWCYADNDPYWAELAAAKNPEEFDKANLGRLPVAFNIEIAKGVKPEAVLVALRDYVARSAKDPLALKDAAYKDQPYFKLSGHDILGIFGVDHMFIRVSDDAVLITPNESVLKRAIDRYLDRESAKKQGKELAADNQPLLGDNIVLHADKNFLDLAPYQTRDQFQSAMQQRSWSNLAILNEWKRRYPDQDPQKIYQHFFHARLVDPAGGEYAWNQTWQTMESSVYGSPAEPKKGPAGLSALTGLVGADFGVTFEKEGLRAKVELQRERPDETNLHADAQDDVKAHLDRSRTLFAKAQYPEAALQLQLAAKIDPSNFDVFMTSGEMLSQLKDFVRAERMYRDATRVRPKSFKAWNNLGVAQAAQGRLDDAIHCFKKALELNPDFAPAKKNLEAAQRAAPPATKPAPDSQPTPGNHK